MEVKDRTLNKRRLFILIGVLAILIAAGGYFYYRHQANKIREEKHNELKAIADLKINHLVQWRKERITDARVMSRSPYFIRGVEQWFHDKTNIRFKSDLVNRLALSQKEYGYESIYLTSNEGEPLLSIGKALHRFNSVSIEFMKNTIKHDSIICSDFYYCKTEKTIHYDIIAPLKNEKDITIAMLVLRVNPYDYLYPFIQSWPTSSKSSESLLIRGDGDSVLFLNDLRFRTGAALTLKIPLVRKDVPAVQAVFGFEGTVEGKDYRNVEVLAVVCHVPGTMWSMVAKVDQDEIFAGIRTQAIIIIVFVCLFIVVCGFGIMWIYHYRQRNIFRLLWQTQEEFRTTLYSIGDAVITTDKKGRVQYLNVIAEQLTGWKEEDAKNEKLEKVFHIINEDSRARVENPVQLVLKEGHVVGLANHTLLISKDGRETPIADSGSPIRNAEGEIAGVVLVFRDQTEERASQKLLRDSETRYRRLFEAARDGILILDAETGLIVDVNPFLVEMLGYTHDQFLGKNVWNLGFFKDIVANSEKFSELQKKEYVRYEDLPLETADGRKMDVEFVSNIYLVDHHKVIQCNIRDITDRKQAEEALRESERKFKQVFDASNVGKSMTLPTGEINVNDAFCKMLGYTAEELKNKKWQDLTPADEIGDTQKLIDTLLNGEKCSARFNKRYIKKDGSCIYADVSVALLRDNNNKPLHFITTVLDVTERKQAEKVLLESERKLREVQKMAQLGNWVWDVRTGDVEWSDEVFNIFQLDPKEFTPHIDSILELSPWPEDHERDKELIRKAMESQEKGSYEQRFLRPDKSVGYYYSTFEGQYDNSGNLIGINGTVQDITERKQAEEALRKSESKLVDAMKIAKLGNWEYDIVSDQFTFNDQFYSLFHTTADREGGYCMSSAQYAQKFVHPDDMALVGSETQKALETTDPDYYMQLEHRIIGSDGKIGHIAVRIRIEKDAEGRTVKTFGVNQDITEQKKMEEGLRQMQKMEGLGTLAGGIAHDFNNILGIILAYITSINRFKDDANKLGLAVDTIVKAVDRGKTLVQQILMFARKTETTFGAVNVNDVVMETVTMVMETFPKFITCSQNFDKSIHYINADRSQLHQVLMNLCVNARDAMPKGGVLAINTRMVSVASLRNQHPTAEASSYVCIEVSDTGEGMTPETQKRIFEPFFTTKGIGKGTGLGLSVTFGVIQTHKGFIDVESELGNVPAGKAGGTTFRVYLPASQVAEPISENDEGTMEEIPGGIETVLLVEDEEMLLTSLQMVLVDKGYKVITATDGLKALKIYQEKKKDIALVITDLGLPNISGLEVCQQIKKINPKELIILATGYLDPEMKEKFLKAGIQHFLFKPYDLKKVLKVTREVLDKK